MSMNFVHWDSSISIKLLLKLEKNRATENGNTNTLCGSFCSSEEEEEEEGKDEEKGVYYCQTSDICLVANQPSQYHFWGDCMLQLTPLPSHESKYRCSFNSLRYFSVQFLNSGKGFPEHS